MPKVKRFKNFVALISNDLKKAPSNFINDWLREHPGFEVVDWKLAMADGGGYLIGIMVLVEIDEDDDHSENFLTETWP